MGTDDRCVVFGCLQKKNTKSNESDSATFLHQLHILLDLYRKTKVSPFPRTFEWSVLVRTRINSKLDS